MKEIKLNILARYGTLITCLLLVAIGVMSWFIKYPETVTALSRLSGSDAPKPLFSRQNARISALYKTNGDIVRAGEIIGYIETTADVGEIIKLSETVDSISRALEAADHSVIKWLMATAFAGLGELQGDYQAFFQAYIPYRDYVLSDYILKKKQFLRKDMSIAYQNQEVLNTQSELNTRDLELNQITTDKNKKLFEEKIISEQEYREVLSQNINKKMSEPQIRSGYISHEAQINAINKEMTELDNLATNHISLFHQAVMNFKARIDEWKRNYLLTAPESGTLNFTSFLQVNQIVESGKIIAYIIPENSDIFLEALIPQTNFGKVESGQKALIKFDAYPWQESGTVSGTIQYISNIPVDSGYYLAKIILPYQLMTNYDKEIPYKEGLTARAEIITKDLRLAQSLYYDLIKTIRK